MSVIIASAISRKVRARNAGSVLPTHVQDVGDFHVKLPNNPAEVGVLSEQVRPPFDFVACAYT